MRGFKSVKNIKKNVFPILDRGVERVLAIGLIALIVIIGIILLLNNGSGNNQTGNDDSDFLSIPLAPIQGQVVDIDNEKLVTVTGKTLTLPDGWRISSILKGFSQEVLRCENVDKSECLVYFITNNEYTFYLSNPTAVRSANTIPSSKVTREIASGVGAVTLNYEELSIVTREGESEEITEVTDKKLYKDVYGALSEGIFVSTGLLPFEFEP